MTVDLLLSSGFLAFGRQAGFLQAIEDRNVSVGAVVGTSSGALAGALWSSGWSAQDLLAALTERTPLSMVRPSPTPWRGAFSMRAIIADLEGRAPKTFEGLERPFAVGVMTPDGGHRLVHTGALAHAVAASCAIPRLFSPVPVDGQLCADGGFTDRIGARAWREWRPGQSAIVHMIDRSGGSASDPGIEDLMVVRTPRSFAKLWSLGDVEARFEEARRLTHEVLDAAPLSGAR
jgi:predicted acylesterase/phospholipase RssA